MKKTKAKKATADTNGAAVQTSEPASNGHAPAEHRYVATDLLRPDPNQPRKDFNAEALQTLADSIKAHGVLQDILVTYVPAFEVRGPDLVDKDWRAVGWDDHVGMAVCLQRGTKQEVQAYVDESGHGESYYLILDGERRWRAANLAGLIEVPCKVVSVAERDRVVQQVIANQQRESLTAIEEGEAYARELEKGIHTADTLAAKLGQSRGTVFGRLGLTKLHAPVREALVAGKISVSVAGLVAKVPTLEAQKKLLTTLTNERDYNFPYSAREVEELIGRDYSRALRDLLWDMDDAELLPAAGSCAACPKRTGNMLELFPELKKNPNVCTDAACFRQKVEAHGVKQLAAAKEEGQKVLTAKETRDLFQRDGDLTYNAKYVDVSQECELMPYNKRKTWKAALGDKLPEVVLAADPTGRVHELLPEAVAKEAAKAAGIKSEYASSGMSHDYLKQQRARQKKEKLYRAVAGEATQHVLAELSYSGTNKSQWVDILKKAVPLLARAAYECTDIEKHAFVAKRRGWTKVQTDCREKCDAWLKKEEDPTELLRFALELLLCARWGGGGYGEVKFSKGFSDVCAIAGVKLEKLLEAAKAEAKTNTPKSKKKKGGGVNPKTTKKKVKR